MRFPAKITSSCIWVAIPVDWVILHWYACGADGRSLARCTVTWLPNFLGWVDYRIFLPMVLCCARFARESSAKNTRIHFKVTFSLSSISSASFCGRQKGARSLFLVSGTLLTVQNRIEKISLINSKNNNKKQVTSKTDLKKIRALEQLYVYLHAPLPV